MYSFMIDNDKNLKKTLTMATAGIDVRVKILKELDNAILYSGEFADGAEGYNLLMDRLISKYNFG